MFQTDNLTNIIEPTLTATSLQPPLFLADSPYIDSCLTLYAVRVTSIKFLLVISMLSKKESGHENYGHDHTR